MFLRLLGADMNKRAIALPAACHSRRRHTMTDGFPGSRLFQDVQILLKPQDLPLVIVGGRHAMTDGFHGSRLFQDVQTLLNRRSFCQRPAGPNRRPCECCPAAPGAARSADTVPRCGFACRRVPAGAASSPLPACRRSPPAPRPRRRRAFRRPRLSHALRRA